MSAYRTTDMQGSSSAIGTIMVNELEVPNGDPPGRSAQWRGTLRFAALQAAMAKRAAGVPTYSVPEAAALLSISQEYLYRLISAGAFPAVRMRVRNTQGRYVIPAKA